MAFILDPTLATWGLTYSVDGRVVTQTAGYPRSLSTVPLPGKTHIEVVYTAASTPYPQIGIVNSSWFANNDWIGSNDGSGAYNNSGVISIAAHSTYIANIKASAPAAADVLIIELDAPNKLVWYKINGGDWNGSPTADPATGTGGVDISAIGSIFYLGIGWDNSTSGNTLTLHSRSSEFAYSPSAGFAAPSDAGALYNIANLALTNGGLTATCTGTSGAVRAFGDKSFAGKHHVEWKIGTEVSGLGVGFCDPTQANSWIGGGFTGGFACWDGNFYYNNTFVANLGAGGVTNDIVAMEFDTTVSPPRAWLALNGGNWNGSGTANPATNTGGLDISALTGGLFASINPGATTEAATINYGSTSFSRGVSSGFSGVDNPPLTAGLAKTLGNLTFIAISGATNNTNTTITLGLTQLQSIAQNGSGTPVTDKFTTLGSFPYGNPYQTPVSGPLNLAVTLGALTISSTGLNQAGGNLTKTLDAVTLTGQAGITAAGTLTKTLGALGLTSTAGTLLTATLSATLGAISFVSTGALLAGAALNRTLGSIGISSTGIAFARNATLSKTLANVTLSSTGQLISSLSGAFTLANITQSSVARNLRRRFVSFGRSGRAVAPPGGFVLAYSLNFVGKSLTDVMRTKGNMWGGFTDGYNIFAQGNEFSTYDKRGIGGAPGCSTFAISPDYVWPGSVKPIRIESDQLIFSSGLAADLNAGLPAVMPYKAASTRYTKYGSVANTWDALVLTGDWIISVICTLPLTAGSWAAFWLFNKRRSPLGDFFPNFEIDLIEYAPNGYTGANRYLSCCAHGSQVAGGVYDSSNTETDTGIVLGGVERTITVQRVGDVLTWWVDGVQIRQFTINPLWPGKDDPLYFRANNDVGDGPDFPGTYVSGQSDFKIRNIQIFKPTGHLAELTYNPGMPDGYGPDVVVGLPSSGGITPGFFGDIASTTTVGGVAKGGILPAVVASTGAYWNRRIYTGHATTNNAGLGFGEPGTTPTNAGFKNGQVYKVWYLYELGTSGSMYFRIESFGAFADGHITAGVATIDNGASMVSDVSVVAHPALDGRMYLNFNWTCDADGDSNIEMGPNSNTSGQTVLWYDAQCVPIL